MRYEKNNIGRLMAQRDGTTQAAVRLAGRTTAHGWMLLALVLVCGWLLCTGSAFADPTVHGLREGQVVSGPIRVWAESRVRASAMRIELIGPNGVIRNRVTGQRVALVEGAQRGQIGVINTDTLPAGDYILNVSSEFRGIENDSATLRFVVREPTPQPQPAPDDNAGDAPGNPAPTPPVLPVDSDDTTTPGDQAGQEPDPSDGNPIVDDEFDEQPTPGETWSVRFSNGLGQSIRLGESDDLPLVLSGDFPQRFDVVVQAWDMDRDRLATEFSHTLSREPWVIRRAVLDTLPAGNVELQLLVRMEGKIERTVKQRYWVEPRSTSVQMPEISFSTDAPARHVNGSNQPIGVNIAGNMPAGGDLLVLAWDVRANGMVASFAHEVDAAPWQVSASRMDKLAEGSYYVQVYSRLNNKVIGRISKSLEVVGGGTGGGGDGGSDPDGGAEPDDLGVAFLGGVSTYKPGSNAEVRVQVSGTLPQGADVLMLAWSDAQKKMVSEFAHTLPADGRVSNAKLDLLPGGSVQLQAMLRVPSVGNEFAYMNITVDKPVVNPDPVDTIPPPVVTPGAGFTVFKPSADTRVVYVSSSAGNDANSGLSADAPIKSITRAKQMLRDGMPDWLLFKAGDVFTSGMGTWDKSGRSVNEKMLVGVYGSGDRPVFRTQGDGGLNVFKAIRHVAFVGLQFHAVRRDPSRPEFAGGSMPFGEAGVKFYTPPGTRDILFEDMRVGFYKDNFIFSSQKDTQGDLRDITLRRNIIHNAHNKSDKGHSQGVFANHHEGLLLEENTFDHNGWNPKVPGSVRTIFNHNIYLNTYSGPVTLRGNIIMRGGSHGSQVRSGGTVEGNLYLRNALALYIARHNTVVRGNVILQSDDIGEGFLQRGDGLEILPANGVLVEGNIFSQKRGRSGHMVAITVKWVDTIVSFPLKDYITNYEVRMKNNIISQWPTSRDSAIWIQTGRANIRENSNNLLDIASGGRDNPPFVDPSRNVETYMTTLKQPATIDRFSALVVGRPRGVWDTKLSAQAVNNYVRQGFDIRPYD